MILETSHANFTKAFESLLGRTSPDAMVQLRSLPPQAMRERLATFVGPLDFSLFDRIDHGALVTALTGHHCDAIMYIFGNALIAIQMSEHEVRAGLYVPLRLFAESIASDRVRITYDLPSSLMAPFGSADVNRVARDLDGKVERLLSAALDVAQSPSH
jgi:hypothetical protein